MEKLTVIPSDPSENPPNPYQDKGFKDRVDYFHYLADKHQVPLDTVFALAAVLTPSKDFTELPEAVHEASVLFSSSSPLDLFKPSFL